MHNVVVTGASRGLGLGIAKSLVAAGYCAICIARSSSDELIGAMEEAGKERQGAFQIVPFDLSEIDKIPHLVQVLREKHGTVYGLVNNAAMGLGGVLATMQTSQIESQIRLNILSPIVLTKHIVRMMMAQNEGRIVNIASIVGLTGFSGLSVYGATKASIIGFTRSLAREVGRAGINVNAVAPGFVDTAMTRDMGDQAREQVIRRSALKRLANIEDVANVVEYLLSEKAKNITGTVITVDAGSTT